MTAIVGLATTSLATVAIGLTSAVTVGGSTNDGTDPRRRAYEAVARLRARSASLRRGAALSLVLVTVALAAGLALFYLAADISSPDLEEIQSYLDIEARRMREVYDVLARAQAISDRTANLQNAITSHDRFVRAALTNITSEHETRRTISIIATRVGAVLILVFLVQILVSLYRYNIRLANYYDARAEALTLSLRPDGDLNIDLLREFAVLIAPEQIQFGNTKSPAEQSVELVKTLLGAHRERSPPSA